MKKIESTMTVAIDGMTLMHQYGNHMADVDTYYVFDEVGHMTTHEGADCVVREVLEKIENEEESEIEF